MLVLQRVSINYTVILAVLLLKTQASNNPPVNQACENHVPNSSQVNNQTGGNQAYYNSHQPSNNQAYYNTTPTYNYNTCAYEHVYNSNQYSCYQGLEVNNYPNQFEPLNGTNYYVPNPLEQTQVEPSWPVNNGCYSWEWGNDATVCDELIKTCFPDASTQKKQVNNNETTRDGGLYNRPVQEQSEINHYMNQSDQILYNNMNNPEPTLSKLNQASSDTKEGINLLCNESLPSEEQLRGSTDQGSNSVSNQAVNSVSNQKFTPLDNSMPDQPNNPFHMKFFIYNIPNSNIQNSVVIFPFSSPAGQNIYGETESFQNEYNTVHNVIRILDDSTRPIFTAEAQRLVEPLKKKDWNQEKIRPRFMYEVLYKEPYTIEDGLRGFSCYADAIREYIAGNKINPANVWHTLTSLLDKRPTNGVADLMEDPRVTCFYLSVLSEEWPKKQLKALYARVNLIVDSGIFDTSLEMWWNTIKGSSGGNTKESNTKENNTKENNTKESTTKESNTKNNRITKENNTKANRITNLNHPLIYNKSTEVLDLKLINAVDYFNEIGTGTSKSLSFIETLQNINAVISHSTFRNEILGMSQKPKEALTNSAILLRARFMAFTSKIFLIPFSELYDAVFSIKYRIEASHKMSLKKLLMDIEEYIAMEFRDVAAEEEGTRLIDRLRIKKNSGGITSADTCKRINTRVGVITSKWIKDLEKCDEEGGERQYIVLIFFKTLRSLLGEISGLLSAAINKEKEKEKDGAVMGSSVFEYLIFKDFDAKRAIVFLEELRRSLLVSSGTTVIKKKVSIKRKTVTDSESDTVTDSDSDTVTDTESGIQINTRSRAAKNVQGSIKNKSKRLRSR